MRAPCRLSPGERVLLEAVRMLKMIDRRQQIAECLSVCRYAADRNSAEIRAVIAAFAPDQPAPRTFAARTMIGQRNLERGIDRLGTGIRKKRIVEVGRHHVLEPFSDSER